MLPAGADCAAWLAQPDAESASTAEAASGRRTERFMRWKAFFWRTRASGRDGIGDANSTPWIDTMVIPAQGIAPRQSRPSGMPRAGSIFGNVQIASLAGMAEAGEPLFSRSPQPSARTSADACSRSAVHVMFFRPVTYLPDSGLAAVFFWHRAVTDRNEVAMMNAEIRVFFFNSYGGQ